MNPEELFNKLMVEVIDLGEDPEELNVWKEVFKYLTEDEQKKIIGNLTKEVEVLKRLKK